MGWTKQEDLELAYYYASKPMVVNRPSLMLRRFAAGRAGTHCSPATLESKGVGEKAPHSLQWRSSAGSSRDGMDVVPGAEGQLDGGCAVLAVPDLCVQAHGSDQLQIAPGQRSLGHEPV